MKYASVHELIDPLSWLERGIQLNQWLGPEHPFGETLVNVCFDLLVPDLNEA
jgi:hypothetical protein